MFIHRTCLSNSHFFFKGSNRKQWKHYRFFTVDKVTGNFSRTTFRLLLYGCHNTHMFVLFVRTGFTQRTFLWSRRHRYDWRELVRHANFRRRQIARSDVERHLANFTSADVHKFSFTRRPTLLGRRLEQILEFESRLLKRSDFLYFQNIYLLCLLDALMGVIWVKNWLKLVLLSYAGINNWIKWIFCFLIIIKRNASNNITRITLWFVVKITESNLRLKI